MKCEAGLVLQSFSEGGSLPRDFDFAPVSYRTRTRDGQEVGTELRAMQNVQAALLAPCARQAQLRFALEVWPIFSAEGVTSG